MHDIECKIENNDERKKFEEYINSLYQTQYKNYFERFSKIFESIQQLNIEENYKEIIQRCCEFLNLIYEKRKYLDLKNFKNYKDFKNFTKTLENERNNDKLYNTQMAQHIFELTEILMDFMKDILEKLD